MTEFDLLTAVQPEEGWYAVVGIKDGSVRQVLVETREEVDEVADDFVRQRRNVFFGVAKYASDEGRTRRNVSGLKALWVDLDCGPTKPYPDQVSGFRALKAFTQTINLPIPIVVNSGRGLHVYWPLTETLTREEWEPLSDRLKALCVAQEFHADPACFEAARILRIPGTYNFKDDPAPEVTIMHKGSGPIAPDALRKLLGVKHTPALPAPTNTLPPSTMLSPMGQMIQNSTDKSFGKIVRRGAQGCAQILSCLQERETLSEPRWFNALSVAKFCRDKDKAIHKLSEGHPDYDPARTEQKIAHIAGPHTCVQFEANNPGVCQGCPHFGKVKSPIVLGIDVIPSSDDTVVEESDDGEEVRYKIPEYPFPFLRGKNGGIWRKGEQGKEGDDGLDKLVYHRDFYLVKRMNDPNHGAVVMFRHHTPNDGVDEFVLPAKIIMDGNELRKELASRHIITQKKKYDLLVDYVILSFQRVFDNEEVEKMRNQFGWADNDRSFIVGNRQITAKGTFHSPPSSATEPFVDRFQPTGEFEKWKEVFNLYGRPGLEAHAFAAATAFGAPLLKLSGHKGAIINVIHPHSGTGKTTILHMCNSVWGDPDKLCARKDDTYNSKVFKLGLHNNLPICFDEMTNTDADQLSNIVYMVSQGEGKDRMKASSNELRVNQTSWQTIALSSSNISFYEKLGVGKDSPEGEMMRIMEFYLDYTDVLDPAYAKQMFDHQLMQNYGFAGDIYIRYIVSNWEEVRTLYANMQRAVDAMFQITQRERFWSGLIASNLTGIKIAKHLGLCTWNLKNIRKYVGKMLDQLRANCSTPLSDDQQIIGEYLLNNVGGILVVEDTADNREANVPMARPQHIPPRDLIARYETDTRKLFISVKPLRHYCNKRAVSYHETVRKLKESGILIGSGTKRMTKGTAVSVPGVHALVLDADHPDFFSLDALVDDKGKGPEV